MDNTQHQGDVQRVELNGLLPEGHSLALNTVDSIATLMRVTEGYAEVVSQVTYSRSEFLLLCVILHSYPHHIPYEDLYALYTFGTVERREEAQAILEQATEQGTYDDVMKSMRNMVSNTRLKTQRLGLEIAGITHLGYIMTTSAAKRRKTSP